MLVPKGGSRRQFVVVCGLLWSRQQQRKTGTRGKETSQCRSNGYLDCCIEAVVQAMEGRLGNPVTKSGLYLGRPGVAVVWVRVAVSVRELGLLAWCCGTRGVEQPMSSVETARVSRDRSKS